MKKLLVFVLAALCLLAGCGQSPEAVVKAFYAGLTEKDLQKVKDNSTEKTGDSLAKTWNSATAPKNVNIFKTIKTTGAKITGDTAEVNIEWVENSATQKNAVVLVKVDGKWKVSW
jgi:ABC-type glycerol-3-phosphate transport system substrate-binding protein